VAPGTLQDVIQLNPLAPIFELARIWVIDPSAPGPSELAGAGLGLAAPAAIYLAVCVLAVWVFNREAPRIAEQL
jgi:ABC-2 type transport system permease protein